MKYQVPLFIERETKIVGPLTFKQFLFVGGAVAVIVILYFAIGKTNFLGFFVFSIFIMLSALALAFVRVAGKTLPVLVENFVIYLFTSRVYLWKRKRVAPKIITLKTKLPEKEEAPTLKISEKSQLRKLSTQIETKTR